VLDFGISGDFSLDPDTLRIVGRVDDGYDTFHVLALLACADGKALISGEVRPDFDPDFVTPFTGKPMTAEEVRRMDADFRERIRKADDGAKRAVSD
jgi:hypothetical protein